MPTKVTSNCETGEAEEVEMEGDELAAYELQQAYVPPDPPPSDAEMIGEMIGSIEFGGDEASEELAAVMAALTGVLAARGF